MHSNSCSSTDCCKIKITDKYLIHMSKNFIVNNAALCFLIWLVFLIAGYIISGGYDPIFARGWMVIWGGVFVACVTALLAFDNMDKIAVKSLKKEQYYAYLEFLTVIQEWKRFTQRIRQEVELATSMTTHNRVFVNSKIFVDNSFNKIDFCKIQFISKLMNTDFSNDGTCPSNYDYFNVGNYSELQFNFYGFLSAIKARNDLYDRAIKPHFQWSKNGIGMNISALKDEINYVDFTDYIVLTETVYCLCDQLIRFLDYYTQNLVNESDKILDPEICQELGGLPRPHDIEYFIDLNIKYVKLSEQEESILRSKT
ncbi:hypothetical protein [Vibrio sp. 10N.222.52.B7]|uniref:hypothetical protein n=1 Tax=Vibrio sp. 10N.222.52.B7 TaxID=3229629 RepID=UPI00354FB6B4